MSTLSLTTVPRKRVPTVIFGAVPDGVASVVVENEGGHRKIAPVARNTYEVRVTNPLRLSFLAARGAGLHLRSLSTPSLAGGSPQPLERSGTG